jgi:major type 1 subunit fimbrin (pilin)
MLFINLLLGIEMKNKLKLMMSGVGLVSALALPGLAQASDGTITFEGALVSSTCTVKLNGLAASGTVTLPTVATTALPLAGNTAGATRFTLEINDCTAVTGLTENTVNAFFESGAGVDPATGNLLNTGTATNVVVQLFPENNLTTQIKPGETSQAEATDILLSATSGTLNYIAQYYATADSPAAGTFISTVTYSLVYN